jgi:hypothetical protein
LKRALNRVQDHNERCEIEVQIQMLEQIVTEAEGRINGFKRTINAAKLDLKTKKEIVESLHRERGHPSESAAAVSENALKK